ncbi:MAG TPA: hypothetical protein VHL54_12640 [Actinomycetota bacterium]|nr:hypothetical protein [Actinomycetota bacterium]
MRIQIGICLFILVCGQILFWRRRDNVLGYVQGGLFLSTFLLPLLGTSIVDLFSEEVVRLYANILTVGALAYLAGLCFGAPLGNRKTAEPPLTFIHPLDDNDIFRMILVRTRVLAAVGLVSLAGAYAILGYVPLLAADRVAAKYGAGPYAASFARGAVPYNFALAVASSALPVMLVLLFKRRRLLDLCLAGGVLLGLIMSLSRTLAFSGVLLFVVALAFERRIRPFLILAGVSVAFVAGALANEIFFPAPGAGLDTLASRVAASAPDVPEQLGFLRGYELRGEMRRGWALVGGLAFGRGELDPAAYTIRTITGFDDVEGYPSGGLRLPAPIWGYVSFGMFGAAAWSFVSGFFTGWGTTRLRNLLTGVKDRPGAGLNLILAAVFYAGTFGVVSTFYFATSSMFVRFAIAVYLGRFLVGPRRYRELTEPVSRGPRRPESARHGGPRGTSRREPRVPADFRRR